jgi:hypothetical protein
MKSKFIHMIKKSQSLKSNCELNFVRSLEKLFFVLIIFMNLTNAIEEVPNRYQQTKLFNCSNRDAMKLASSLNEILNYRWMVTASNQLTKPNILYEISLCEPSSLCSSTESRVTNVCKLKKTMVKNQIESKTLSLGFTANLELTNISDG